MYRYSGVGISRKRRKIHKMWKTSFLGWALASMLILAGSASADSFTFTSAGSVTWNGVYVNPYQAVDNTHTQHNPLTIYCDDWNTDFSGYPTWNATVYSLTASNVTNFKYGNTTSDYIIALNSGHLSATLETSPPAWSPLQRYLEAAWLDDQWRNVIGTSAATADTQIKLAAAVWTLFVDAAHVGSPLTDPNSGLIGAINNSGYATDVYNYLQEAQTAVTTGGYTAAGWDVIVPDAGNGFAMQEFLVHTPEPSAVILLGTVVGVLGLTKFRRKRQA
jgi:hypothetical protein